MAFVLRTKIPIVTCPWPAYDLRYQSFEDISWTGLEVDYSPKDLRWR